MHRRAGNVRAAPSRSLVVDAPALAGRRAIAPRRAWHVPACAEGSRRRSAMTRLLIVAPNWLGDAVMALPAIADVRRASSGTTVAVAAKPAVASLFALVK